MFPIKNQIMEFNFRHNLFPETVDIFLCFKLTDKLTLFKGYDPDDWDSDFDENEDQVQNKIRIFF